MVAITATTTVRPRARRRSLLDTKLMGWVLVGVAIAPVIFFAALIGGYVMTFYPTYGVVPMAIPMLLGYLALSEFIRARFRRQRHGRR